jgi:hypothetical protein
MSKVHELLKVFEATTRPTPTKDIVNAFLPVNTELVSANSLLEEIQKTYSEEVAKDFVNFVLKRGFPKHPELLIEFFKTKKDFLSQQYLAMLQKQSGD